MSQTLKDVVIGMRVPHRASLWNSVFWELKGHMRPSGRTTAGDLLSKSIPMGCVSLRARAVSEESARQRTESR